MTDRSLRPDVRNPLLALPEMQELIRVLHQHPEVLRAALALMAAIRRKSAETSEKSWRKHKAPMAYYWKVVGVYFGHISRAIKGGSSCAPTAS